MRSGIRLLVFVAVTLGVLVAAFFGLARRFTVPTNAMEPSLKSGDHVAVFRFSDAFTSPGRKDIVVVKSLGPTGNACFRTDFASRLIGLPGETVTERSGIFSVDDKTLTEPYVKPARRDHRTNRWRVPQNAYLLVGDNRRSACAAPTIVLEKDVVGPVFLTYWPLDRISIG